MVFQNGKAFNGLFWVLYFLYQWLGLSSLYGDHNGYFINSCLALPVSFLFSVMAVHYFFPKYYQTNRKIAFWLSIVLSACILLLLRRYFNYYIIYPRYFPFALQTPLYSAGKLLVDFVNLFTITGLYALYYAISYWYQEKQKVQQLLQQQTLAELELLRSQVQPHFVFNTLNNIYSTALKTSPGTAALIAHLSGFLSYNLYDAPKECVALTAEIEHIKHYIALQKNRYGSKVDAAINIFDDVTGVYIAPLLLLPLVENCFTHGVSNSPEAGWIRLDITHKAGELTIVIENSHDQAAAKGSISKHGLGLANVRKRLELLYPAQHSLKAIEGVNAYLVVLKINIHTR